jgi:hypothetical protein
MATVNQPAGVESSLANWAGEYVTDYLGRGKALGKMPYTGYEGPLTAGPSGLQTKGFSGLASLALPTGAMGGFKSQSFNAPGTATSYMNPYLEAVLEPQRAEAIRQADIKAAQNRARMTQAGAYGGSRQAILEAEADRNLMRNLADITGKGYADAFDIGRDQFNTEQDRSMEAQDMTNRYGLDAIRNVLDAGRGERDIEAEGIAADIAQFEEERDFPYNQLQWMQSLLSGMPVASKTMTYTPEDPFSAGLGSMGGLMDILKTFNLIPEQLSSAPTEEEEEEEGTK